MSRQTLWHRAQNSVAQQCLTNSKHVRAHVEGIAPTHFVKGQGCFVWDEAGRRYTDFVCGLGASLAGYANETINRAAIKAMGDGVSHSLSSHYEIEAAEKLKEIFPFIDRVKFVKTGSDACSAAVKIARNTTGRQLILSEGYHGHDQEFCRLYNKDETGQIRGLKPDLCNLSREVAAVIIEPVIVDYGPERYDWIRRLMTACKERGILVIFDEVITGFRFKKFGVCNWMNVIPDLLCGGKSMANGLPLAFVAGKAQLMDDPGYFVSSTYAGDTVALAAATTMMTMLLSKKLDIERLWLDGAEWIKRFNGLAQGFVKLNAYPTRGVFEGTDLNIALFLQETVKAGLFFGKSWCINHHHMTSETQLNTFTTLEGVFKKLRDGKATMEGPMPKPAFAQKVRDR